MKKILVSILGALLPLTVWCADGDTFTATTAEGVTMTFKILSMQGRICQVGDDNDPAIANSITGTVTIPQMAEGMSVISIGENAFSGVGVEEVVIPPSVVGISQKAFMFAGIKTITLPSSITEIGEGAFWECMNLETIYSQITTPFAIDESVFFYETYENATLYVPTGTLSLYESTFAWSNFIKKVEQGGVIPEAVPQPTFTYNGRYLTMACTDAAATIHYTLDGTTPTSASPTYTEPVTINYPLSAQAIAISGSNSSAVANYAVRYCFDGNTAWCEEPGLFEHCFDWCNPQEDVDSLIIRGIMEPSDINMLHSMNNLWYLDMRETDIMSESLPQGAFAGSNLRVYISPYYLNSVGENLFANCQQLAAVEWNANTALPASALNGVNNPNLLLYVNESGFAPDGITNVVVGDWAEHIVLTDAASGNNNFFCPRWFKTHSISYTREFSMETEIGVSRGWESICLPFTVQRITHETNGDLAPFGSNILTGKPFWLRQLTDHGLENAGTIEAGIPYIICMPNNPMVYTPEYNQAGKVMFYAEDAEIYPTFITAYRMGNTALVPAFSSIPSTGVYAINRGEARGSYKEGSVFELNYREVRPFEAYTLHTGMGPAPRFLPVGNLQGDAAGIDDIKVMPSEGSAKYYNLAGQRVSQPKKGLYIVNGQKVVIK